MDLLRSYELYELLQLYIVSEVAMTANSSQLYAALFTSLPPKPIDLGTVKQKYNKVFLVLSCSVTSLEDFMVNLR